MPTPSERIVAGIKARNLDELNNRDLDKFKGKPKSVSDIVLRASAADVAARKLQQVFERLNADIAKETERATEQYDALTSLPRTQRDALKREHVSKFRLELVRNSSAERFEILKELRQHHEDTDAVSSLYSSSAHLLSRYGLGSEARSRLYNDIAPAGVSTIAGYIEHAINDDSDEGKMLAAALMTKLDSMPAQDRKRLPYSRNQLADAVMGDEHAKAVQAMAFVRNRYQEGLSQNRKFESNRAVSGVTVRQALDRRAEGSFALDSAEA